MMNLPLSVKDAICGLAKKHGLEEVILFGSRARGDNHERSDIDLAVRGAQAAAFALDVDEEVPTLLMFDVVDLSRPVQEELLEAIRRDGICIYRSQEGKE